MDLSLVEALLAALDEEDAAAAAIRTMSAQAYPHIAALGAELLSGPGQDRFAWGLSVLITVCRTRPGRNLSAHHHPGGAAPARSPQPAMPAWRLEITMSVSIAAPPGSGRLTGRLRALLVIVLIADVLDLMDSTITNIAAPSIAGEIGGCSSPASPGSSQPPSSAGWPSTRPC